jgi:hypothetical protein
MKRKFQTGRAALLRGLGFWRRGSAALPLLAAMVLFFAMGAAAETTNTLSDAETQGRQLARQLCESRPSEDFTNSGVLQIHNANGSRQSLPMNCETITTSTNWATYYSATVGSNNLSTVLIVSHFNSEPNRYELFENEKWLRWWSHVNFKVGMILIGNRTMIPFANSDFWLCDLGLEFFHWPAQKVLPKPTNLVRGRDYTLLESTNPNPSTNGYSRVLSWIDKETGGILQAEAYDANGKLLKEFSPKSFKKVNGQWELQEMEIRNVQTGSRTRLEFDLNKQ